MVKTRVLTALAMLFVVGGLMFFASHDVWLAAISAMVAWAAAEWANLAKMNKWERVAYVFAMPALLGAGYAASASHAGLIGSAVLLAVVFWISVVPMWLYFGWQVKSRLVLALVGLIVLLPTGWCLIAMRPQASSAWFLLGLLAVVWIADTAAFLQDVRLANINLHPPLAQARPLRVQRVLGLA